MLRWLHSRHARLAAPLVQPGLFDRRALRDAEAQQRLDAAAVLVAAQRIVTLQQMLDPQTGGQRIVFAVM